MLPRLLDRGLTRPARKQPLPLLLTLMALLVPSPTRAASAPGTGYRTLVVRDPVGGGSAVGVAYYPSRVRVAGQRVGPYAIDAAAGAPVSAGRFPLVAFSHGSAGSRWSSHDLATALARRGYIVATLEHPGDSYRDRRGVGTDRVLVGRALQMSSLVDAVLADPRLRSHVDAAKIGAAGFSAGGYTALLLAGARPNFGLLRSYCRTNADDSEFCGGWRVALSRPPLRAKRDPRVRAVLALAPVGIYFDRSSLAGVRVPVDLWAASADRVLRPAANAERIRALLHPSQYHLVKGADHDVFLAPCTPVQAAAERTLCYDPPGVDRRAVHAAIVDDAARFFRRAFASGQ